MKKFLNIFFVVLGVIFLLVIIAGASFFMVDPLNLKSMIFGGDTDTTESTSAGAVDKNPMLNESQEAMLETFGIDPASVPSEITPAQEACFVEKLGADRVAEIKAGDTPSALEFFKAKDCIE